MFGFVFSCNIKVNNLYTSEIKIEKIFVTNSKDCKKLVSKPSFVPQKIFNENLVPAHKIK